MNVRHPVLIDPCYFIRYPPNHVQSSILQRRYTILSNADVYFCLPMSSSLSTNMLFLNGLADDFADR